MNKTDLTRAISKSAKLTLTESSAALDATMSTIIKALQSGEEVSLKGFGTFKAKTYPARIGHNPKTGNPVSIPEKKQARFKFSKEVKLD